MNATLRARSSKMSVGEKQDIEKRIVELRNAMKEISKELHALENPYKPQGRELVLPQETGTAARQANLDARFLSAIKVPKRRKSGRKTIKGTINLPFKGDHIIPPPPEFRDVEPVDKKWKIPAGYKQKLMDGIPVPLPRTKRRGPRPVPLPRLAKYDKTRQANLEARFRDAIKVPKRKMPLPVLYDPYRARPDIFDWDPDSDPRGFKAKVRQENLDNWFREVANEIGDQLPKKVYNTKKYLTKIVSKIRDPGDVDLDGKYSIIKLDGYYNVIDLYRKEDFEESEGSSYGLYDVVDDMEYFPDLFLFRDLTKKQLIDGLYKVYKDAPKIKPDYNSL